MAKKKGGKQNKGKKKGGQPQQNQPVAPIDGGDVPVVPVVEEEAARPTSAAGISLGNCAGAVAVAKVGADVEIVANHLGQRTTPAIVGYDGDEVFVGVPAAQGQVRNAKNTATNFYALLGAKFSEVKDLKAHSCTIVDKDGMAWCKAADKEEPVSPVELAAKVLGELKAAGATKSDGELVSCVMAVPYGASEELKASVTEAVELAGMKVAQFISEPVAATLAYGLGQADPSKAHTVVVYNMGGHKATATVVLVRGGVYQVLASAEDEGVGGKQLDQGYTDYLVADFKKSTKMDMSEDARAMRKLAAAIAEAKHILSTKPSTAIAIESLFEGVDYQTKLMRTRVDLKLGKVYRSAASAVTKVLGQVGLAPADITDCLLAGGCTATPKIKSALEGFFAGEEGRTGVVKSDFAGDEIFAVGAAKQGELLLAIAEGERETIVELTTTPHDIGFSGADGVFVNLIAGGTPIPVARTFAVTTAADGQTSVGLELVEKAKGVDAKPLVTATLTALEPGSVVTVAVEVSKAGELRVQMTDNTSGKSVQGSAPAPSA